MLVLTRREGESVVIGDDVVVTVVEVRGDVVRLGIDAPREVKVHRAEVWKAVSEANAAAAAASDDQVAALTRALSAPRPPRTGADRTAAPARPAAPAPAADGAAAPATPRPTPRPQPPRRP